MTDNAQHHAILVGVDGSVSALQAARWGAREAKRHNVPLRLLHTSVLPPETPRGVGSLPHGYGDVLAESGRQWLADAARKAEEAAPGVRIEQEVQIGLPAERLIEASANARLLVLGSRGLGGFSTLLLGSVALVVSGHARCPVVVMRGETAESVASSERPVVVGLDGGPTGDSVLAFAIEAASMREAPLVAVHTWHENVADGAWVTEPFAIDVRETQDGEERLLSERLVGWREKYPDVELRQQVIHVRRPLAGLLEAAKDAQLVVVGTRGRNSFTGMLLGSTSQGLLHRAGCPVAVIPPEAE